MKDIPPVLIEWKADYEVGFERFDQEHRQLLEYANRIITSLDGGLSPQELDAALCAMLGSHQ